MNIPELLSKFGLTKKAAVIYAALIEGGPMTVSGISRKTRIQRPLVYKEIPFLLRRGLITLTYQGVRKFYIPEPPQRLQGSVRAFQEQASLLIPRLVDLYRRHRTPKPVAKVFEGRAGIRLLLDDIISTLKRGDAYYRISSSSDIQKERAYCSASYRKRRDLKQLERYLITNESTRKEKTPSLSRHIKIVPASEPFSYNVSQAIYADKVAFVDYNSETGFVIESALVAEFHKKLFFLLWDLLPGAPV